MGENFEYEQTSCLWQVVKVALDVHTSEMAGDILVFLTGNLMIIYTLSPEYECTDYR